MTNLTNRLFDAIEFFQETINRLNDEFNPEHDGDLAWQLEEAIEPINDVLEQTIWEDKTLADVLACLPSFMESMSKVLAYRWMDYRLSGEIEYYLDQIRAAA